ncbi:phage tail protein [Azospirillum sp.]|uniref:phage tail protein n=1 Tax=Azospirillum sp. TaxID=34012 RepID=UPI003D757B1F
MDAFYGEIRIFGFNFPPQNWAQCNGQTLQIMQFQVLYTILGVQFGGDGQSTFKLPNLMGSAVCNTGQSPGLTSRAFGKSFGATAVTLLQTQMPAHQHTLNAVSATVAQLTNTPTTASRIARTNSQLDYTNTDAYDTTLAPQMVGVVGGGGPHENRQPFLVMNFCICTYGEYPLKA